MIGYESNRGIQRFRVPPTFSLLWTLGPRKHFRMPNFFFSFPSFRGIRKHRRKRRRFSFCQNLFIKYRKQFPMSGSHKLVDRRQLR